MAKLLDRIRDSKQLCHTKLVNSSQPTEMNIGKTAKLVDALAILRQAGCECDDG